jgi:hypothetical protein
MRTSASSVEPRRASFATARFQDPQRVTRGQAAHCTFADVHAGLLAFFRSNISSHQRPAATEDNAVMRPVSSGGESAAPSASRKGDSATYLLWCSSTREPGEKIQIPGLTMLKYRPNITIVIGGRRPGASFNGRFDPLMPISRASHWGGDLAEHFRYSGGKKQLIGGAKSVRTGAFSETSFAPAKPLQPQVQRLRTQRIFPARIPLVYRSRFRAPGPKGS